jgi:hypothetical protein
LAVVVCVFGGTVFGQPWDGNGTPNDPYRIATAEDLNDIGNHPEDFNKHFIMVNDINLADYTEARFNMIGIYVGWRSPDNKPFRGVFDGNGHSIYRFTHSSTNMIPVGLFRLVNDPNARIMNLRLVEPKVDAGSGEEAGWLVGSLVGYLEDGTVANCRVEGCRVLGAEPIGGMVAQSGGLITDCYAEGTVIGTYVSDDVGVLLGLNWHGDVVNCSSAGYAESNWGWDVGGLVGNLSYGNMINCYSTADCNGEGAVGGLVGHNYYSSIVNSYSTGNVSGLYDLGGLVGENPYGTITGCYSTGDIAGDEYIGGLAGTNKGTITDSYSTGSASATEGHVGGLIAWNWKSTVSHCYSISRVTGPERVAGFVAYGYSNCSYLECFWDSDINPDLNDIGNVGDDPNIIGLPTAQMQDANTFIDAGWDFNTPIWKMCDGLDYPKLGWEECPEPPTLLDVVSTMLDPNSLKNSNMKNALLNKIDAALQMIDEGQYQEAMSKMESASSEKANRSYEGALNKLENDILAKTDGCAETGEPDKNDWITSCEEQTEVYPLIIETIEYVRSLME